MHRHPSFRAAFQRDGRAARAADRHGLAQHRARGGRAERHHQSRPHDTQFLRQPPAAGLHLARVGGLVDAPLAAPLELEMLDRVGDIGAGAVHARLGQRLVQQLPRRPDEGPPGQILLVAGLLADEHQRRVQRAFAEHGLRRVLVERAAGAAHRLVAHRRPDRAAVAAAADGPTAACRFGGPRGCAWRGRRACDHCRLARLRARDQVGDERRFGQVAPIFLGHFRQHRPGLEPGRVEDRGIIAFPQGLDRVAIGRIGTGRARPLA